MTMITYMTPNADSVRPRQFITWSGSDGWRHVMRAETQADPWSVCGKSKNEGQWAMHMAEPSCPECLAQIGVP